MQISKLQSILMTQYCLIISSILYGFLQGIASLYIIGFVQIIILSITYFSDNKYKLIILQSNNVFSFLHYCLLTGLYFIDIQITIIIYIILIQQQFSFTSFLYSLSFLAILYHHSHNHYYIIYFVSALILLLVQFFIFISQHFKQNQPVKQSFNQSKINYNEIPDNGVVQLINKLAPLLSDIILCFQRDPSQSNIFQNQNIIYCSQEAKDQEQIIFNRVFSKIQSSENTQMDFDQVQFQGKYIPNNQKIFSCNILQYLSNNYVYLIIALRNESFKEQIENLNAINMQNEQLITQVSHDFKSLLNSIELAVQCLEQEISVPDTILYIGVIKKTTKMIFSMIKNLLDFKKVGQQDGVKVQNTSFVIEDIIDEVIDLYSLQAKMKGIKLEKNINLSKRYKQMYSDSQKIKSILMNFVSNSLKFTEKGFIKISLSEGEMNQIKQPDIENQNLNLFLAPQFSPPKKSKLSILFQLEDTGSGIEQQNIQQLFQKYLTFGNSQCSNSQGTGLGLFMCKEYVSLLGPLNDINVTSIVGKGTTFKFYLYLEMKSNPNYSGSENSIYISNCLEYNMLRQQSSSDKQKERENSGDGFGVRQIQSQQIILFKSISSKRSFNRIQSNIITMNKTETLDEDQYEEKNNKVGDIRKQVARTLKFVQFEERNYTPPRMSEHEYRDDLKLSITHSISNRRKKILIVDDDVFSANIGQELFKRTFDLFEIEKAYDAQSAIDLCKQNSYDYIFLDLDMPRMSGYQAIGIIKQIQKFVIVIATTGYEDEKEQRQCLDCGFDAFITKPMHVETIKKILKQL